MTRGSLTTFSISNDIASICIIPAAFAATYHSSTPQRDAPCHTPERDPLAVIFNAIVIVCLIPLALRA